VCVCQRAFIKIFVNLHAVQTLEGRAELQELMAISKQVLNGQTNKPTFGLVQDTLTGSYLMTRKDTFLPRDKVMHLMMAAEKTMLQNNPFWELPLPAILKPEPLWTGKQVYSLLFPSIHLSKIVRNGANDESVMDPAERCIHIHKGELLCGALCKATLGAVTGGVVHVITKDYSMERACLFLSDAQKMVNTWLINIGFTVGLSDCVPTPQVDAGVRAIVDHAYKRIARINESLEEHDGNPAAVSKSDIEEPVANILRDVINQTGRLAQAQMSDANHIYVMNAAGSKGNAVNMSQIMACVGQQTVDGRRIHVRNSLEKRTNLATRTMTCYAPGDEHPETHGFCPNSYIIGLEPEEMYMHAMGGREGLVDTAVKSVTYDTTIIILQDGVPLRTKIGAWIDQMLKQNPKDVTHFEKANMEYLELFADTYIPTVDRFGQVSWSELTAVTRHDPSEYIYRVTTKSGRVAEVVDSNSLLVWQSDIMQFLPKHASRVKVGDCMPTTQAMESPQIYLTWPDYPHEFKAGLEMGLYLAENVMSAEAIPDQCYAASDEYIRGLLAAYISTDNTDVDDKSITMTAIASGLAEGLAWLCSRLSILGLIRGSTVVVEGAEATKLVRKVQVTSATLQRKLSMLKQSDDQKSWYSVQDHVILDPVVRIEMRKARPSEKVYDVTVPSTTNFCLANGLHVVDTSVTGYIQRRLLKAMEALQVQFDGTVRNAEGYIVDFLHGGDGMDPQFLEPCSLFLVKLSDEQMQQQFQVKFDNATWNAAVYVEFNELMLLRDECRRSKKHLLSGDLDTTVLLPAHIPRIMQNVWDETAVRGSVQSRISPPQRHALIQTCLSSLKIYQHWAKLFLEASLKSYMSSATMCRPRANKEYWTCEMMAEVLSRVQRLVHKCQAEYGEMVGALASESIGEPSTQLTLNT
jgi:hypothetical protein